MNSIFFFFCALLELLDEGIIIVYCYYQLSIPAMDRPPQTAEAGLITAANELNTALTYGSAIIDNTPLYNIFPTRHSSSSFFFFSTVKLLSNIIQNVALTLPRKRPFARP